MSQDRSTLIQSSDSIKEAMELTGRTEPVVLHGKISVLPTEEVTYEVVCMDHCGRVMGRFTTHIWSQAEKVFRELPRLIGVDEQIRHLNLILNNLSVHYSRYDRITNHAIASGEPWGGEVEVF